VRDRLVEPSAPYGGTGELGENSRDNCAAITKRNRGGSTHLTGIDRQQNRPYLAKLRKIAKFFMARELLTSWQTYGFC
jgi:hypothetical protein